MRNEKKDQIIFTTTDGKISINALFDSETAWLSLDQMAELFERDKSTISRHIKNIFDECGLGAFSNCCKFCNSSNRRTEVVRQIERQIEYYNLDVIISVSYRIKSMRGTQF